MHLETGIGAVGIFLLMFLMLAAGLWVRRLYMQTVPRTRPGLRRLLTALRVIVLALIALVVLSPLLLNRRETAIAGRVAVLVEDSASQSIADQPGGEPRWKAALAVCRAVDSLLSDAGGDLQPIYLRGNGLSRSVEFDPFTAVAPPDAIGSDLARFFTDAAEVADPQRLRGMILISDGNESPAVYGGGTARRPSGGGGLIVGVGSEEATIDYAVLDLDYPRTAFVGEEILIEVEIGSRAAGGRDLEVFLESGGRRIAVSEAVFNEGQAICRTRFTYRPETAGTNLLQIRVAAAENENYLENNRATIAVDVSRERSRILALIAAPDWNTRFLAQAAVREPRLEFVVAHPTADGMRLASGEPWRRPESVDDWLVWEAVVLDAAATREMGRAAGILAEAVAAGLGLLILGDDREAILPPEILDILPGRPTNNVQLGAAPLSVAAASGSHPVMAGLAGDRRDAALIAPISDYRYMIPGPSGVSLLEAISENPGRPRQPVLVAAEFDQGRLIWCGTSGIWQGAFRQRKPSRLRPEYPVADLLGNALVWLAVGGRHDGVRLPGGVTVHEAGLAVELEAISADLRGQGRQQDVLVRIVPQDRSAVASAIEVVLKADPTRPGRSSATLPTLPPGRYQARIAGDDAAGGVGADRELVIVPSTLEGSQMKLNSTRLRSLARRRGADYLDVNAEDFDRKLAAHIGGLDPSPVRLQSIAAYTPFDGWRLLLVLILLLSLEWSLRRRLGMI